MPTGPKLRVARFPRTTDTNPYQGVLYTGLARRGIELGPDGDFGLRALWRRRGEVDLLHLHWRFERFYQWRDLTPGPRPLRRRILVWPKAARFVARLGAARMLGFRLAWTVHELHPHQTVSPRADRLVGRALLRLCDLVMAHDAATAERARAELGPAATKIELVPHPSYAGVYRAGRPRAAVRAELGIPERSFAFLCFGNVRAYKEVGLLLDAFQAVSRDDVVLVVAGRTECAATGERLRRAAARDRRVMPLPGFVPEGRVAEVFGACDAAALVRGDGWTSGSLVLALSLGLAPVVADLPAYRELIGDGAAGWLFRAGDRGSLRAALEAAAADPGEARAKREAARARAGLLAPEQATDRTAQLMLAAAGHTEAAGSRPVHPAPAVTAAGR